MSAAVKLYKARTIVAYDYFQNRSFVKDDYNFRQLSSYIHHIVINSCIENNTFEKDKDYSDIKVAL